MPAAAWHVCLAGKTGSDWRARKVTRLTQRRHSTIVETPSLKRPSLLNRTRLDDLLSVASFLAAGMRRREFIAAWCDGMAACRARGVLKPISRAAMIRSGFRKLDRCKFPVFPHGSRLGDKRRGWSIP